MLSPTILQEKPVIEGTREITSREAHGVSVRFLYDFDAKQAIVNVESPKENFTLYPPDFLALDVFNHPYAYADRALKTGSFQ